MDKFYLCLGNAIRPVTIALAPPIQQNKTIPITESIEADSRINQTMHRKVLVKPIINSGNTFLIESKYISNLDAQ